MKHQFGTQNKIIATEEKSILAKVDQAIASSGNSQTIGRNGEIPLISFLDRFLPNTLKAKSGHFLSPSGVRSPQIDVLILDSRYPLLSENADGSVLAMLHSVVGCVEVKTKIRTSDLPVIWRNSRTIRETASEVFDNENDFSSPFYTTVAYRTANRLATLADKYENVFANSSGYSDLTILRVPDKDMPKSQALGVQLHFEPMPDDGSEEYKQVKTHLIDGHLLLNIPQHTPLSDFYYSIVQDSYYCLDDRAFTFGSIGVQFMKYMTWSTAR